MYSSKRLLQIEYLHRGKQDRDVTFVVLQTEFEIIVISSPISSTIFIYGTTIK